MKKLIFFICLIAQTAQANDLFDAIKELDVTRVKEIFADKTQSFNKEELRRYLEETKAMIRRPVISIPWYKKYGSLAKIGAGSIGLILSARFLANAVSENPESSVTFGEMIERFFAAQPSRSLSVRKFHSIHAPLCVLNGAIGALSAVGIVNGINELREHSISLKAYALRALVKQAAKLM